MASIVVHLQYTNTYIWVVEICIFHRLLEGLGATKNTNIFWAGGKPLGGEVALRPLINKFGRLYNKETLALPGELDPFLGKASCLAAIDYLISLHSDVFMPSHGGNMARALQVYFHLFVISFLYLLIVDLRFDEWASFYLAFFITISDYFLKQLLIFFILCIASL